MQTRVVSLSAHTKNLTFPTRFKPVEVGGAGHMGRIMTECRGAWSPIVWEEGRRKKANFKSCDYLALDVDEGWPIEKMQDWLAGMKYLSIIGTTKSHQKEKKTAAGVVKPPCDRYRVVIPFERTIVGQDEYEFNMEEIVSSLEPADESCKDAGRLFFPCKEIVHVNSSPELRCFPVREVTAEWTEKKNKQKEPSQFEVLYLNTSLRVVAPEVKWVLRHGPPPGESRHKWCYIIGARLASVGYSSAETINKIMASPLAEIGHEDIERAVINGRERHFAGRTEKG